MKEEPITTPTVGLKRDGIGARGARKLLCARGAPNFFPADGLACTVYLLPVGSGFALKKGQKQRPA